MSERILLAVDTTPASEDAVRYAGDLLGGSSATFVLFHLVEPPPTSASDPWPVPGTLEPVPRRSVPASRSGRRRPAGQACGEPTVDRMAAILVERHVDARCIEEFELQASQDQTLGRGILEGARQLRCRTIVVGRHALPWYRETLHPHVCEWLTKHAAGFTLCLVGGDRQASGLRHAAQEESRRPS